MRTADEATQGRRWAAWAATLLAALCLAVAGLGALFVGVADAAAGPARTRLVLGLPLEPPNLDPTSGAAAAVDEVVYGNVFEGLTRITQNGTVAPALAESWEVSPDGLTYVFHLRRGVVFHDGSTFDASDVKFSLDRITAETSTNAQKALFEPIRSVEVLDPATVRVTLAHPVSALPTLLAWGDAVIVAPESAAANASNPIGTGPFRLFNWRRGNALELRRNPTYWGPAPRLEAVEFRFISDPTAAFSAVSAGDIDAFPNYPAPENVAQFERDPRFRVVIGASEGKVILGINNRNPPLNDVRVRRAISYAIDRKALIDGAMFGFGQPIGSHYSRQAPGYVDLTGLYPHDVARARRLLAEAGYPDGIDLTLRLPPRPYARRGGEVLAAQLGAAGIRVKIENLEWAQWLDQVFKRHQFDLTIVEHVEPMDYDIYARDDYYFGYRSEAFNALVDQLGRATDDATRLRLQGEVQRRIAEDAVNGFLLQSSRIGIWKADLQGLWINAPIAANVVSGAYFTGGQGAAAAPQEKAGGGLPWGWLFAGFGALVLAYVLRQFGAAYLLRRLGGHAVTLAAATVVIFLLLQVVPGDPASYMMGLNASPEAVAALREQMGLEGGALERYLAWVGDLVSGRFGISYTYQVPVGGLIADRLAVSGPLALMATLISLVVAFPIGAIAASRRGSLIDAGLVGVTQVGIALPNFWIAMLLILFFSINLGWFSAGGFPGWDAGAWPALKALLLPAVALAAPQAAILARVLRTALLDTLNEDYMRTARAKGLSVGQALRRHALRNALIPVLTILGLQFPFLLAGGIIIENVFSLPGLGRLVFQAITQRDLIVVQGVVMVLVFSVVVVGFLIDLAYVFVDPRLRGRRA
ncbi:MAG: ABC transporter permease subunit [Brevundimonas sp.]|uniref:ABC transporter substrate-binding protein n=1 Tax=Brevundimonas sp. TaxID=1871086 RepID=UPI0025C34806|nr:ABC transporter substrate-binding protein [Brevundimonas sp.]MBX3476067.1 ABC transporter permease subunit [Brevundimonas sp.]